MHSIYVDSTSGLVVGLLDSNFKWLEYKDSLGKKPSEVIHMEIYQLINRYQLNINDVHFFFSAGPGSYTGMRLGEGMAQMFAWDQRQVYSFYHFDVPRLSGITSGSWVTNAFKGQVFFYSWKNDEVTRELVDSDAFQVEDSSQVYTLSNETKGFENFKSTQSMIKESPEKVFSKVFAMKLREKPYYFRTLDEEFK